jgi:hypothetical protein
LHSGGEKRDSGSEQRGQTPPEDGGGVLHGWLLFSLADGCASRSTGPGPFRSAQRAPNLTSLPDTM